MTALIVGLGAMAVGCGIAGALIENIRRDRREAELKMYP